MSLFCFVACEEVKEYPWNPIWDENTPEEPSEPEEEPKEEPEVKTGKARLVWIDSAANFDDYANSKSNISADMKRLKDTGFTGVIVEVRPTTAGLLFNSDIETPLTKIDAWTSTGYVWLKRTETFDYLQAFIDAGKEVGLDVYAAINTMVGGKECPYNLGTSGPLYQNAAKREWATVINTEDGLVNCMDLGAGTKFLNPANDEVVEHLLGILEDLAKYDVKGIILDRCRYDDYELFSDFSEVSRTKFEAYLGEAVPEWPVEFDFVYNADNVIVGIQNVTDLQVKWMEFRAKMIHDFVEKASDKVHSVNPDIRFGAYVGAWYSSYYFAGVNWASPSFNPKNFYSSYSWVTEAYQSYGYADHTDIMIIGAYASTASIKGTSEWTMQGFCNRAKPIFGSDVTFIGGPDIGNSTGFEKGGQGKLMPSIVDACINASTEGMFFFDLCHIKMYDYWDAIKTAFDQYLETL